MKDYSECLIEITKLIKQYRKLVLKGEYEAAADVAVDMGVLCCELQEWTEKCIEIQNS
jgi:hypothetical protein